MVWVVPFTSLWGGEMSKFPFCSVYTHISVGCLDILTQVFFPSRTNVAYFWQQKTELSIFPQFVLHEQFGQNTSVA